MKVCKKVKARMANQRAANQLHGANSIAQNERFEQETASSERAYRMDRCPNYEVVMEAQVGRVALVTNFSRFGERSPEAIGATVAGAVAPADITVIEVILPNVRYERRQKEYMGSAHALRDEMHTQRPGDIVVTEETVVEEVAILPETIAGRMQMHIAQNPGSSVSYVALTSALGLDYFGHKVENDGSEASRAVYDSVVDGAVLVPPIVGYQDSDRAWQIYPLG